MPGPGSQNRSAPVASAPTVYRVVRGDTLYSIAFRYGLDWREVARWNGITAPYTIRVGQPIALRRPVRLPSESVTRTEPAVRPAPRPSSPPPEPRPEPRPETGPEPRATPPSAAGSTAPIPTAATRSVAGVDWRWPTAGTMARGFDPGDTRKGILVAGTPGQPVRAAAGGTVVYSGAA